MQTKQSFNTLKQNKHKKIFSKIQTAERSGHPKTLQKTKYIISIYYRE